MHKVKLFRGQVVNSISNPPSFGSVEDLVNQWFEENHGKIQVISVNTTGSTLTNESVVTILYTEEVVDEVETETIEYENKPPEKDTSNKYITIQDGQRQYKVPLSVVAENRTDYYASKDKFHKDSIKYIEEYNYVMNDDFEGIDWLQNNMDWDEFKKHLTPTPDEEPDDWVNAEKDIIEY